MLIGATDVISISVAERVHKQPRASLFIVKIALAWLSSHLRAAASGKELAGSAVAAAGRRWDSIGNKTTDKGQ